VSLGSNAGSQVDIVCPLNIPGSTTTTQYLTVTQTATVNAGLNVTGVASVVGNVSITGGLLGMVQSTRANNSPGTAGQISTDTNYIYVCTAANTWKRVALTAF
jgi:hypothetical protein